MRLKVKNWSTYQHYKDRCPPWIKLATNTFQNYEFSRLQDASKLLAVCIWTLASREHDGTVPHDFAYIKSQCCLGDLIEEKHLTELIESGFLVASEVLADCKQDARPEERRDRDRGEAERASTLDRSAPLADSDCGTLVCRELGFTGMRAPRETTEALATIRKELGFTGNWQVFDFLTAKWRSYEQATPDKFRMKYENWINDRRWMAGEVPRVNGQPKKIETPYERTQRELREACQ